MNTYTNWFPSSIKPIRKGLYQIQAESKQFSFWNGKFWGKQSSGKDINFILAHRNEPSIYQDKTWRGILKESK